MNAKYQQLLTFAHEFRERHETGGLGTQYPSVRECAKELGVTQKVALALASDLKDQSYPVDILVGYRTTHGHAAYDSIGDYLIEVYDDSPDEAVCENCGKHLGEGSNPGELCLTCRGDDE